MAEPLVRAGAGDRTQDAARHPDVAISLNNPAEPLSETGAETAAESSYRLALTLMEQAHGPDCVELGPVLVNLRCTSAGRRRMYAWAELLYERALKARRLGLGNDHPAVAMGLNNAACLYQDVGSYAAAQRLFDEALAIAERVSGPQASSTGTILGNMAFLADGRTGDARSCSTSGRWSFSTATSGLHHPTVGLPWRNGMRRVLDVLGQLSKRVVRSAGRLDSRGSSR
ncbi:MAG: tetratricopeptide repeat protein [Nitrospira sp.]|nr:tetratricopeptide repeat protein [Nitrospira sp.]